MKDENKAFRVPVATAVQRPLDAALRSLMDETSAGYYGAALVVGVARRIQPDGSHTPAAFASYANVEPRDPRFAAALVSHLRALADNIERDPIPASDEPPPGGVTH